MTSSEIGRAFADTCAQHNLQISVVRVSTAGRDWQVEFEAGGRTFTVSSDHRDGFVFLELLNAEGDEVVVFDQGQATALWLEDRAAFKRAAVYLELALRDRDYRGAPPWVL